MGTTPYPCEGCGVDRSGPFLGIANVPDKSTKSPLSVTLSSGKWAICLMRIPAASRGVVDPIQWLRRPDIPQANPLSRRASPHVTPAPRPIPLRRAGAQSLPSAMSIRDLWTTIEPAHRSAIGLAPTSRRS
jgi:hypothetical protein